MHEWVLAPGQRGPRHRDGSDRLRFDVDAHRNHRGPYTAAGDLVRRATASAYAISPALVLPHALTLLSVAPEVRDAFPVPEAVTAAMAFSREGDARAWTLRLAHGVTDFFLTYVAASRSRACVSFTHVDDADWTDQEFLAVLLRRADPGQVRVRIVTSTAQIDEPLRTALESFAEMRCEATSSIDHGDSAASESIASARAYVDSNCTSDSVRERDAYADLPSADRAALHGARAAFLARLNEPSLRLGAIPFHVEQARGDPAVLASASATCMGMAYYHAALDWAVRGRRLIAPGDHGRTYADLTRHLLFSLMRLGRFDEASALCDECLAAIDDPALLANVAYAYAIMYARWYEPARRDNAAAVLWVERATAFALQTPPSPARAVNLAFLLNTRALVEMREGRHGEAIRLLTEALASLSTDAPEHCDMESPLFLKNRAKVHLRVGEVEAAIADWTRLLSINPSESDIYMARGIAHHRQGRPADALRDYDAGIACSPPWAALHFNRAQALKALGRPDEALAEYDRALVLDPGFVAALVNRACMHFDRRSYAAARADVDRALRLSPDDPQLLCLDGLLQVRSDALDLAEASFTRAIERDPALADAWANRATVRFKQGDLDAAVRDLTHALGLREDATILSNRGRVFEALGRRQEAADDYARALAVGSGTRVTADESSARERKS